METGKNPPACLLQLLDEVGHLQKMALGAIERHLGAAEPGDIRRDPRLKRRDHLRQPLAGAHLHVFELVLLDPRLLGVGVTLLLEELIHLRRQGRLGSKRSISARAAWARRTNHQGAVVASAASVPVCFNTSRRVNITFTESLLFSWPPAQALYHPLAEPCELGEETTLQTECYGSNTLHPILSTSTLLCYPSAYRA